MTHTLGFIVKQDPRPRQGRRTSVLATSRPPRPWRWLVAADVVGVQETHHRLPQITRKTGHPHDNVGLQLQSQYPIDEPSGADPRVGERQQRTA
jgi:hypothetical protein